MIYIISDIGSRNPLSGMVDLHLAATLSSASIQVISHDFNGKDMLEVAYYCRGMAKQDNDVTIISLVGLSYSYDSPLLCMRVGRSIFISFDNGLLPMIDAAGVIYELAPKVNGIKERLAQLSECFQSSDNSFWWTPSRITTHYKSSPFPSIIVSQHHIKIHIIHVNKNGDVITNLARADFEQARQGRSFIIKYLDSVVFNKIYDKYTPSDKFELIAYYNEFDFVEFSISDRSADTKELYDFHQYGSQSLINTLIKIEFQ